MKLSDFFCFACTLRRRRKPAPSTDSSSESQSPLTSRSRSVSFGSGVSTPPRLPSPWDSPTSSIRNWQDDLSIASHPPVEPQPPNLDYAAIRLDSAGLLLRPSAHAFKRYTHLPVPFEHQVDLVGASEGIENFRLMLENRLGELASRPSSELRD